jgi:hypothetical protein
MKTLILATSKAVVTSKTAFIIALVVFFAVLLSLLIGCKTQLDPAGVYHGDTFLFNADQTIGEAGSSLNAFVTWELQNRARLTNKLHSITVAADAIRLNAPVWFTNAVAIRNAYSNAVALSQGPVTIGTTSNALSLTTSTLKSQALSASALTNSF